jgi:hypothetical protein
LKSPKIVVRPHTEIVGLEGGDHLESVRWQNNQMGQIEEHKIRHIFIMTGADPNTHCLNGCVVLDVKGFIKTGPDLSPENLTDARWPLTRQPYLLETRAYTNVNPMINQSTERIARPEKVCMSTEREFLLLIKPDSKKNQVQESLTLLGQWK